MDKYNNKSIVDNCISFDMLTCKLDYLFELLKKYLELNKITNGKFDSKLDKLFIEIETLEDLRNNTINNWDKLYIEDLKMCEMEGFTNGKR